MHPSASSARAATRRRWQPFGRVRRFDLMHRFPTTLMVAMQYGPLVVLPAISNGRMTSTVAEVLGLGLLATVTVEGFLAPLRVRPQPGPIPTMRAIRLITCAGVLATVASGSAGSRSYAAQVGAEEGNTLIASLSTPFVPWALIGSAFALIAASSGQITKGAAGRLVGFSTVVVFAVALQSGIVSQAAFFIMPIGALALILGLIRLRVVLALLVVAVLVWPTIYEVRNDIRVRTGATYSQVSAGDAEARLNLDGQVALLDESPRYEVEPPSLLTAARYGLLPSAIDSGRAPLTLGPDLNRAYGGSGTSSLSLTLLGNLKLFVGWQGLVVYMGLVALALRLLLRSTPTMIVVAALVIQNLLWVDATYPVSIASFLQSLVCLLVALPLLRWLTRRQRAVEGGEVREQGTPRIEDRRLAVR